MNANYVQTRLIEMKTKYPEVKQVVISETFIFFNSDSVASDAAIHAHCERFYGKLPMSIDKRISEKVDRGMHLGENAHKVSVTFSYNFLN